MIKFRIFKLSDGKVWHVVQVSSEEILTIGFYFHGTLSF